MSKQDLWVVNVSPEDFVDQREKIRLRDPDLMGFYDSYNFGQLKLMGVKTYLSRDMESGFGIDHNGKMVNFFSLARERGNLLVKVAILKGATNLSCLGEFLRELYTRAGFVVIRKEPWNDEYAPKDWNFDRWGKMNYYEMEIPEKEIEELLKKYQKEFSD